MDEQKETPIELRSEKVRNVIGRVPPLLIRAGITWIACLLCGLGAAACFIPYPDNVRAEAELVRVESDSLTCTACVPYADITRLRGGQPAKMEWEGYPAAACGYTAARVCKVFPEVVRRDGRRLFRITIRAARKDVSPSVRLQPGQGASALIRISHQSLLRKMLPF